MFAVTKEGVKPALIYSHALTINYRETDPTDRVLYPKTDTKTLSDITNYSHLKSWVTCDYYITAAATSPDFVTSCFCEVVIAGQPSRTSYNLTVDQNSTTLHYSGGGVSVVPLGFVFPSNTARTQGFELRLNIDTGLIIWQAFGTPPAVHEPEVFDLHIYGLHA